MHDLVIRGGTIVDGLGGEPYVGDVAIDGTTLVQVGGTAGPGKREIEAAGLIVTPGWVDIHTHYDGQATWDPMLTPSCWHGVTTVLMGNCGVGFAPVRASQRDDLIELMEGVEEIPGITLTEGLKWDWESFPDYLDMLDQMDHAIDVAAQVPHHALRVYVMGDRAIRRELANPADIAEMKRLTKEALEAGAFGFTTSRTNAHKTVAGEMVPARNASIDELLAIGSALGEVGHGAFGMLSDFDDEEAEFAWMTSLALQTGRPVYFLHGESGSDPERIIRFERRLRAAREKGARVAGQVAGRPVGVLLGVETEMNPFSIRPSYAALRSMPLDERMEAMRDPELRRTIIEDQPSSQLLARYSPLRQMITTAWDRIFILGDPLDYEPPHSASVAEIARREGRTPDEVAYDYIAGGPENLLFFPISGYAKGNHDVIRRLLTSDTTILGLADAGAHCSSIVDSGVPSYMLTHWVRDRSRGDRLPLQTVVKMQTNDTASFYGFNDRGRLAVGYKADVNVIDLDRLTLHKPELRYDLPAGGRRLVQRVDGYRATIISGTPVFENGEHTGAMVGKLVRASATQQPSGRL